jgi:hypothetical protein
MRTFKPLAFSFGAVSAIACSLPGQWQSELDGRPLTKREGATVKVIVPTAITCCQNLDFPVNTSSSMPAARNRIFTLVAEFLALQAICQCPR